jgi:transcriptional regulator with XRE-family HTH domain
MGRPVRFLRGSRLLTRFLNAKQLSMSQFGEAVGCTKSHVCGIARGKTGPSLALALRIEEYTASKVPSNAWTLSAVSARDRSEKRRAS